MSSEEGQNREPEDREEPTSREPDAPEPEEPGAGPEPVEEEAEGAGEEEPGVVEEPGEHILDLDALAEEEPEDEPATEDELTALAGELELARRERDEYLEGLRRLKAEFENSRKRQEREKDRILQVASERLVVELLPVLDNLERALQSEGDIREGVRATLEQLSSVLGEEGLTPVASDGQTFDPNVHEAVMGQPSEDHEEGEILQTFQRGYLLNGKPIRPAKVVVARQV